VKHQKIFCQIGMCDGHMPDAEIMSSTIEPESEEVRK